MLSFSRWITNLCLISHVRRLGFWINMHLAPLLYAYNLRGILLDDLVKRDKATLEWGQEKYIAMGWPFVVISGSTASSPVPNRDASMSTTSEPDYGSLSVPHRGLMTDIRNVH